MSISNFLNYHLQSAPAILGVISLLSAARVDLAGNPLRLDGRRGSWKHVVHSL
jgi:hypothetical protein